MTSKPKVRERYPTLTISVGREEQKTLNRVAEERGFINERGALPGGLVRALLRKLWPFLESTGFNPERCAISPDHAWALNALRNLEQTDPPRWAMAITALNQLLQPADRLPKATADRIGAMIPPLPPARRRQG